MRVLTTALSTLIRKYVDCMRRTCLACKGSPQRSRLSFEDAAGRLLSSQFSETCMEWLSTAGSYTALSASDCVLRQIAPCAACFENHLAIALPDSPPPFAIRPPTQKVPP